jgi:hypothetical protein
MKRRTRLRIAAVVAAGAGEGVRMLLARRAVPASAQETAAVFTGGAAASSSVLRSLPRLDPK